MPDCYGMKGMWVHWMLNPCCDFQLWPHPWTWPWIFNVKFWNSCISGTGGTIKNERKGFESIGCCTYFVTLSFDLDHGFSRSNFENAVSQECCSRNGRADWHETKQMWVDRMLDSHCDLELWPHTWPLPWIFKVNFSNSCSSGTGRPIKIERKEYESKWCCTYYVT